MFPRIGPGVQIVVVIDQFEFFQGGYEFVEISERGAVLGWDPEQLPAHGKVREQALALQRISTYRPLVPAAFLDGKNEVLGAGIEVAAHFEAEQIQFEIGAVEFQTRGEAIVELHPSHIRTVADVAFGPHHIAPVFPHGADHAAPADGGT